MPLAIQFGMPLNEFWHGDMRLLECYRIAYERNISYNAWQNGARVFEAISKAIYNGFGKKQGAPSEQFSDWKDPVEKKSVKKEITDENIDEVYRDQQIAQVEFLRDLLNNIK